MSTTVDTPPTQPAIVFVAGATGYTGRAVVAASRRRGLRTIAHVRPDSSSLPRWQRDFGALGAEVDTTPWDATALRDSFVRLRPTHVFALLGITRARGKKEGSSYESVDYGLTALLIDACVAADITPRFIYLSSLGADAPRSDYMRARAKAEAKLRASGLPHVIARPSFITGSDRDDDRPGEHFGAAVVNGATRLLRLVGARGFADDVASISNTQLAEGLVHWALATAPGSDARVVTSRDLRGDLRRDSIR